MALVKKYKKMKVIGEYKMPTRRERQSLEHLNITRTYTIPGVFIVALDDSWYPRRLKPLAPVPSCSATLAL